MHKNFLGSLNLVEISLSKINVPSYTGKVHYNKLNPVSHYDQFGGGYTTTAAFHK